MRAKTGASLGLPFLLAFTLLAIFVIFNGFLSHVHTARMYQNGAAVAAGLERGAALRRLLSLMQDSETGQRGFVITGDEAYLAPYTQAMRDLAGIIDQTGKLITLGPEEARLFATLREAATVKKAELEATIALRREKGFEAARQLVLTNRGFKSMDEIRGAVAAIEDLESKELARLTDETRVSYFYAVTARVLSSLLGLGLVFAVYRVSRRSVEARAAEAAVRHEQAERFRVTLSSIGDAVIVTDAEAKVRFMNPIAEQLTGWNSEYEGRSVKEVFHIRDEASGAPGKDPVDQVLRERKIVALENHTELVTKSGGVVPIDDSAAPIFDADQTLTGVVLVFRDIVRRRQAERLARSQKEALEEGDRRKNEFLAVLAHELRNPLAALRNAIEVLRLVKGDSPDGERARDIIQRQVRQMARMVDDLIDVARISTGRMTLRRAPVEIKEIVDASVETTAPLFREKPHRLEVQLPSEPVFVDGDSVRLSQVVTNLLGNAVKYTETGGHIELQVARDATHVTITVRDNGMGMSAGLLPHVFDLFHQGQPSVGSSEGGLGIGLTLARRIVDLHGGKIEAKSQGGSMGSTFTVTLPLAVTPRMESAVTANARAAGHRVLIIEDNLDALHALETVLRLSGYQVIGTQDGPSALAEARRAIPTVALIDLGLPGMTGFDVAQALKSDPAFAHTTLVAVTGWAQEEDRQQSVAAGFDHHLVKPVEPEALLRLIGSLPAGPRSA